MTAFFHSIRWRVQAWHAAILLAVILAFCLTAYQLAWNNQLRSVDRNLAQAERLLMRGLLESMEVNVAPTEPFSPRQLFAGMRAAPPTIPPRIKALFQGNEPGYAFFTLLDSDGRVLIASSNAPKTFELPATSPTEPTEEIRTRLDHREMIHRLPDGVWGIIGMDLTPERIERRRFAWSLGGVGFGVWLLGLAGGWWLAGRAMKPVSEISQTATRIAAGNLTERIPTAGTDSELDQLSRVLNRTFDRLHEALERQKQFTADASHELRTPVTILLAETQRILKRERTTGEYEALARTCYDAAARMRQLIEALLLLARQEAASANLPLERCDLAVILRATAAQLQPLATTRELKLDCSLVPAPCVGDPSSLAILATNLVANALQHHDRAGGIVRVTCGLEKGCAMMSVTDDGPGIPAADLPHVFERFYRADQARSGSSGHTGLGLAIAKAIVTNHGGTLTAENLEGRGCRFVAQLPSAPAITPPAATST